MASSPLEAGEVIAEKYRVEHTLGSGAMGVVIAAWHVELGKRVAMKVIHPEAMGIADAAERFRREARAAANIRSEHAAKVFDVGTLPSGQPYMVMEFLEGHDLAHELSTRGPLPIDEAAGYLLQAIEAIAEAHVGGIAHRDLKPANLFLCHRPDGSRFVKVLDFGISKAVGLGSTDVQLTRTSTLIGSPLYMSPEQMRAVRDIDPRTDVWSLGVILFELLAGRPPFLGESVPELCATMLRDEPPPLSLFRADVPPSLERVILRCLAKDRERRYATVAEIAQDLVEFAPQHRVHAERAIGVVRAANARLSMSGGEIGRGSTRLLATPAPSSQPSNLATASGSVPGVTSERSPTSPGWTESGSAKPNRARVVALGAAGAALLGLITASILLARSSGEPAEVTTNGSDASAAARPAAPPVVTPIVTNPTAAPAGDSVTSSGASGSAPSASAPKPSRPRVWKPIPPPATTAAPAPASPPPADGLPDFGGRR
jgi:serine/threonine protein kinase